MIKVLTKPFIGLISTAFIMSLLACNTVKGIGDDTAAAGKHLKKAATHTQKSM